jgi:hypothetical protein
MTDSALLGKIELHYLEFWHKIHAEFSSTIILHCNMNNNSRSRFDVRWSDKPPTQAPLSGFNQKHAPGLEQTTLWFSN